MRLKSFFCRFVLGLCCVLSVRSAIADDYAYLTNHDPYYPHLKFPKLTTPQWVGEEGVDAVVVLAIDDMRDPVRYERFLRPILKRLKQIDGRAPVSIMTNSLNPKDAQLTQWLDEGLSIDVHTIDHPCPLLKDGDFKKAKSTYDRCVDLISQVKGNRPVAFRMPCCDSLNTVSPRFFAEIFNKTTAKGNYLTLDTSVFHIFSDRDPDLPRELLFDADGKERFRKYIPKDRGFVNTIENYPYPYVIGNLCWEFPCVVPSDWSAQHRHGVNNPVTVSDLKAALDLTVIKKGVFNLVFHPHGWIKNTQVVDLIDHAVKKHGKKVKFLTFREAQDRLNRHLLVGQSLRDEKGKDRGVRLVDVNRDGYMDVMIGTGTVQKSRIWNPNKQDWDETMFMVELKENPIAFGAFRDYGTKLFYTYNDKQLRSQSISSLRVWDFCPNINLEYTGPKKNRIQNIRSINLNGNFFSEVLVFSKQAVEIFVWRDEKKIGYYKTPFDFPKEITSANKGNFLPGLRFIDINEDGLKDLVYSDHERYSLFLMDDMKTGWKTKVFAHKRNLKGATGSLPASAGKTPLTTLPDKPALPHTMEKRERIVLPPIVNEDGSNNGFFVHSHHLFWQNEHTAKLPNLVAKVSFHNLLKDIKPRPKSPEMSLKAMQPRAGFQVQLVAAEPLVKDPVAFEWGADGKLWVAEMADYPLGLDGKGKSGGRIRVLQDTNHDGVYDRSTIFLDGLNFPNGVMPWKKGVLITAAPDIIYAEDTNGDGNADVKKVLYTGFGEGNQQHRVNGLVYGLDHWLYCANGDSHGFIRSTKLDKIVNIRGRDLRIQPDTGKLDTVTGQTQFGRNRDDWGNWFGCNNSNPMFHFVLDDRYLRRNPYVGTPSASVQVSIQPGAAPCYPISRPQTRFNDFNRLNRFTSACGVMIYRDTLFGKRFVQNSFVSEPVHNLVHREILKRTGVTFQSQRADDERRSEFLSSRDNWFRPTMLKTGPDGALYIADMYREHIEHPEYISREVQQGLDFRNGHDKGRIYRIFPTGTKLKAIPNLAAMKTSELVAALDSSSGWQRDTAQRLLIERNDPSAVALLKKMLAKNKNPLARLHALCTLSVLGKFDIEMLRMTFEDKHPGVRRRAILVAENLHLKNKAKGWGWELAFFAPLSDPDPFVRMQFAYSLGAVDEWEAEASLALMSMDKKNDKYLTAALMSSINRKNLGGIFRATEILYSNTQFIDRLIGMAASMGEMKIVAKGIKTLIEPDIQKKPTAGKMASMANILDALRKRNRTFQSVLEYIKNDKQKMERRFEQFLKTADKIAFSKDTQTSDSDRIAAIRLLSYNWDDGSKFETLFQPKFSHAVQSAAISALGKRTDKKIANVLLANWRSYGPSLRREVLEALLQKDDWVNVVLEQLQQKKMHIAEIDAVHRQRLLNFPNFEVREKAKTVFGNWKIDPNRQKVLTAYKSALELKPNLVNGRLLFNKHCAVCHKLNGMGHVVGPDLAALKNKSSENLLVAILDPNRNIESKYLNYIVVTVAGKSHQGLLTDETGGSVTIVAQEDKRTVIPRGEIDQLVSTTKSTMPEGLEKDLEPQAIADIMAYVQKSGPTRKRKTFAGNAPTLVKPDAKGALLLTSLNCEIYGPSLVLENKYGNLGFWSSPHDEAIWTIDVPASGEYDVEIHWALPGNAGGTILFECGAERLSKQVPATGSWDIYKKQSFGTIKLKKGVHHFAARSQGKIQGALIDLKSLRLVRILE